MCPWQLLASAGTFISVMSAYSVFLGPMCGIMVSFSSSHFCTVANRSQVVDYWIIRSQRVKLSDLYRPDSSSIYWYTGGFNLRAFGAWAVGWAPQLPGFIATVNPSVKVPAACMNMYFLAFPLGFAISSVIYYGICKVFPIVGAGDIDDVDYYGTFTPEEAMKLGVAPLTETMEEKLDDGQMTPREKELGGKVVAV